MIDKEMVIKLIRIKGPIIPVDLTKELKSDTLMIGATLSELARSGKLLITSLKRGGSPYYYLPEQRGQLTKLSKYLNEKDRRTFEVIKEKKVLMDKELTPLLRVSLRNIKDYAKPIEVRLNEVSKTFWKWYMLENGDVAEMFKKAMKPKEEKKEEKLKEETPVEDEKEAQKEVEIKKRVKEKEEINKKVEEMQKQINELKQEKEKSLKEKIENKEKIIVKENKIINKEKLIEKEELETKLQREENKKQKEAEKEEKKRLKEAEKALKQKEKQQKLINEDILYSKIKNYFNQNNIKVKEVVIKRKNKDIECIIFVPSPVGEVNYFCKIKDKKKCDDNDLAGAYVDGQTRKLPVLFITTGEVTKKALARARNDFSNMKIKNIK